MQRAREIYWLVFRPVRIGACGILVDSEDRVLLVRQSYSHGWFLPGGGVAKGESPIAALQRELREELRITLSASAAPIPLGVYLNEFSGKREYITVYIIREWDESRARVGWEIERAEKFPLTKLPRDISAGAERRIAEFCSGRVAGYRW